jgi:hypothetical protein
MASTLVSSSSYGTSSGWSASVPKPDDNNVEIAVVRQQLAVLRRRVARPVLPADDSWVLEGYSGILPNRSLKRVEKEVGWDELLSGL